jgi:hypothetical protein
MSVFTCSVRNARGSAEIPMEAGSVDEGGGLLFSFPVTLPDGRVARFRMRLDGFGVLALSLQALSSRGKQAKAGPVRVTFTAMVEKEEQGDAEGNQ